MDQQTTINNPPANADPGEVWPDGDLPSQGGSAYSNLMPGIDDFTIPANLAQLWDTVDVKDGRAASRTFGQVITRLRLKFDKNAPLVVASGPHKGETFTCTLTSNPRPRGGKGDDPATPWVSDLAYLLDIGLADHSRPTTAQAMKAAINKAAGKVIRIEHGLSAHCRADKVRYVIAANGSGEQTIVDPTGQKGCGDDTKPRDDKKGKKGRYYTRDFKDPATGGYVDTIECECGGILRGFPSLERFVPPAGKGS